MLCPRISMSLSPAYSHVPFRSSPEPSVSDHSFLRRYQPAHAKRHFDCTANPPPAISAEPGIRGFCLSCKVSIPLSAQILISYKSPSYTCANCSCTFHSPWMCRVGLVVRTHTKMNRIFTSLVCLLSLQGRLLLLEPSPYFR